MGSRRIKELNIKLISERSSRKYRWILTPPFFFFNFSVPTAEESLLVVDHEKLHFHRTANHIQTEQLMDNLACSPRQPSSQITPGGGGFSSFWVDCGLKPGEVGRPNLWYFEMLVTCYRAVGRISLMTRERCFYVARIVSKCWSWVANPFSLPRVYQNTHYVPMLSPPCFQITILSQFTKHSLSPHLIFYNLHKQDNNNYPSLIWETKGRRLSGLPMVIPC